MNLEKKTLACILVPACCLVFGVSTLAMLLEFEPFYSGYYTFAWWSYILFISPSSIAGGPNRSFSKIPGNSSSFFPCQQPCGSFSKP